MSKIREESSKIKEGRRYCANWSNRSKIRKEKRDDKNRMIKAEEEFRRITEKRRR
jgi:hypothetical protein